MTIAVTRCPCGRDDLDGWEEILVEVERVTRQALGDPQSRAELADGLKSGYSTRDALLKIAMVGSAEVTPSAIWTLLAEHAEALMDGGYHATAFGCTVASLAFELDAQPLDHPDRGEIDAFRRRVAAVLDAIDRTATEARATVVKGPDLNTTRH